MAITLRYSDPLGIYQPAVFVSLGSNVRFGDLAVTLNAMIGEAAISTIAIDDPGGVWDFAGLRAFDVIETSAPSNNQIIGRFAMQEREIGRSAERAMLTGADRLWTVELADFNWHLGRRILVDADAKRPAETAGDRIRWLLSNAAHITLYDYGYVTYPSHAMDACDYRGQRPIDLLADCCVEGGYNFWCQLNEAHGTPELFFMDPDSASYASTLAISNVLSDVDGATIFAPYRDATLKRSPLRIAFGVYLAYANGAVYERNETTGLQFARIDQTAPMSNVKTAPRARRVAQKFLADNDEEDDHIIVGIKVPAAQVNAIRQGHRLNVRFSHLPGYETERSTRVISRSVMQEEEGGQDYYKLLLELVPVTYAAGPMIGDVFAGIIRSEHYTTTLGYAYTQAVPPVGWDAQPVEGAISVDQGSAPFSSITVSADMTVRIQAIAQNSGVRSPGFSLTLAVRVNGAIVGSDTQAYPDAGLGYWATTLEVDLRSYALTSGDVVSVTGTADAGWTNFGANETFLRVGRGTFIWPGGSWVGP